MDPKGIWQLEGWNGGGYEVSEHRMGMYGDVFAWRFRFMKSERKRNESGL